MEKSVVRTVLLCAVSGAVAAFLVKRWREGRFPFAYTSADALRELGASLLEMQATTDIGDFTSRVWTELRPFVNGSNGET